MSGKAGRAGFVFSLLALMLAVTAFVLVMIIWVDDEWVENRIKESRSAAADWSGAGAAADWSGAGAAVLGAAPDRVYVFGFEGLPFPSSNFINDKGVLSGYMLDMTRAICEDQKKRCSMMYLHDADLCWNSEQKIGQGIAAGYVDGCVNWVATQDRDNVFKLSLPMETLENQQNLLIFKANLQFSSLGNRTVGIVGSSFIDAGCLRRAGETVRDAQVKLASSDIELKNMLDNDEVQFAFTYTKEELYADPAKYSALDGFSARCALGGTGLMTRKSERDLVQWFNTGLQNIRENGRYRDVCQAAEQKYGRPATSCF